MTDDSNHYLAVCLVLSWRWPFLSALVQIASPKPLLGAASLASLQLVL
jgi:hypothetical protein